MQTLVPDGDKLFSNRWLFQVAGGGGASARTGFKTVDAAWRTAGRQAAERGSLEAGGGEGARATVQNILELSDVVKCKTSGLVTKSAPGATTVQYQRGGVVLKAYYACVAFDGNKSDFSVYRSKLTLLSETCQYLAEVGTRNFFWVHNRNSATWRKHFRNRNSATFK